MLHILLAFVLVLIPCSQGSSLGAYVSLTSSPRVISPGNTPSLTLRCAVEAATANQPDLNHPGTPNDTDQHPSVDIAHITAIIIIRTDHDTGENQTLASVTSFDPAKSHTSDLRMNVAGTTESKTPGEVGFLEVRWPYPSSRLYGSYTCEVFALDHLNMPEEIIERVQVGINDPTTEELVLYIGDIERRLETLEYKLNNIGPAEDGVSRVQSSTLVCVQGSHDYPVLFSAPFIHPPTVFAAVAGGQSADSYVLSSSVLNVSITGFTLRCSSYQATNLVWVALV